MREEAEAVVRQGEPSAELTEFWTADMRYRGQGHELAVTIPGETTIAPASLKTLFEREYAAQFGRVIPGLDVEVLNWTLRLSAPEPPVQSCPPAPPDRRVQSNAVSQIVDPAQDRRPAAQPRRSRWRSPPAAPSDRRGETDEPRPCVGLGGSHGDQS